ncbi:MAG: hypothetical protein JWO67_704 [Streptosporangiaceae bacterium]|jgi:hypothetical protein|nr:hypothetical protein [Streptosporangiaceae bacterium]
MEADLQKLFVRQVDIGVAYMDVSTEDGVVNARVVVQQVRATDDSGQDRELALIYEPARVPTLADALRKAAEQATTPEP